MSLQQRIRNAARSHHVFNKLAAAWLLAGIHQAAFGQAVGGLSKTQTALQTLKSNLDIILPIAAVIIGIIIFVLYSAEVLRKDDAIRWGVGVLLAGSAAELVVLLWK